jgi:cobalamin biosynthesis protein CobT
MARLNITFPEESEGKKQDFVAEGEYGFKIVKAELTRTAQKKTKQITVRVQVIKDPMHNGKYKGKKIYDNLNLLPQSLWVFRQLLEAVGTPVKSGKKLSVDTTKLQDKKFGGTVAEDEYEDKIKSRIVDRYPFEEVEDRAAGTSASLDEDGEEPEEEEDEEAEDEEEDEDEEEEADEEEDEDEEAEDEDEETDDEDEEEEKPKRRSRSKVKAKAKTKAKSKGRSKKQLEEIDLDEF